MVFSELHPINADFSAFLAGEGKAWTKLSLLPWNAAVDNRSFIVVETQDEQAGWGTPFDVFNRPTAAKAMTVVKLYFTAVLVRVPEKDRDFLILHRNIASVDHLLQVIHSYTRFMWPTFAAKSKLQWFFPQLQELKADNIPDSRTLQDLTVAQFADKYTERNVSFPSFRIEVREGTDMSDFEQARCCIGLTGRNKATELIKAWDNYALQPRRPAQELDMAALEIFSTRAVEPALTQFDKLPSDEKTDETLQALMAAALADTLVPPLRQYTSIHALARALREKGNLTHSSSRLHLQSEAEHLLSSTGIGVAHADPWYELNVWARMIIERIHGWILDIKANVLEVPHDLLPHAFVSRCGKMNLRRRNPDEPLVKAPKGLHMAGKIVRNRTLICVNLHPVEVVVAATNIEENDFPQLVKIISTTLEAFAWDTDAYNRLKEVKKAIEEGQKDVAKERWKLFIEATLSIPKAKGSTFVLIVSKLANNSLANGVAKNIGDLLLKTNEHRDNQAMIRFWRNRFGGEDVVVQPPLLKEIPVPAEVANRRLAIAAPQSGISEEIFKPSESMTFCTVKNCEVHLNDFFICPLHHRTIVEKLKEKKVATIAPKDFADIYGAKRVWAGEAITKQTPLDLNDSFARSRFHLETLALHNPGTNIELPSKQLRVAQMIYHTPGVDVPWGSRSYWKNKELLLAVESVTQNISPISFQYKEIPTPKAPFRADVPPEGEALEWVELPGHLDHRNDPDDDFNVGRPEEGVGGWKTLVLRKEFAPPLGYFSTIGRQEQGASLVFRIDETGGGTRKVHAPILAVVRKGRAFLLDPLGDHTKFPKECEDLAQEIGFPVSELLRQMREKAAQKIKCDSFYAFPELYTLASFAELHKKVNLTVSFNSLASLQHAKNYMMRWGKIHNHQEHPRITMFAIGKAEGEEHLPQCFFMYKQGWNLRFWRPVRPGMSKAFNLRPITYDEKYEFRFVCHMLATEYFPGYVSSDNLLGLINEDLYPTLEGRRSELYGDLELAIASLAMLLDLNDAKSLSKLNFVGGELTFTNSWQRRFFFFKKQSDAIRSGSAHIREFQEDARRNLLQQHFPKVLDTRRFTDWLKKFLPVDPRFTDEFLAETFESFKRNAQFPCLREETIDQLLEKWFGQRRQPAKECAALFAKSDPPPPAPLRAMWALQRASKGIYSKVAEYERAKARMERYFEDRHQRTLEYRERVNRKEREGRRTSAPLARIDSTDEEELSTDSDENSDIEFLAFAARFSDSDCETEPATERIRPRKEPFVFDEWRKHLRAQQVVRAEADDDSVPELETEDENVDECPEVENPDDRGADVPLPRQIRPITPEGEDERELPVVAQILEDPEFRPLPDGENEFECRRFFPHERYDELFDSGDADKFAEFAQKTREGVRMLLEEDLQYITHERAVRKVEAVFQEALQPDWFRSKLNKSEERNKKTRVEHPIADIESHREADNNEVNLVADDFSRVNKGQVPQGVWKIDGEVIAPHRSDRIVKFTDEADGNLESGVRVRDDWGKSNFSFDNVVPAGTDLHAVRPLPMSTYGKWKPERPPLADTRNARKMRYKMERNPNTLFNRNMRMIGIERDDQYVPAEQITLHESQAEMDKIQKLAQILSNKGMGMIDRDDEAADELTDIIQQRNVSTTQILANLCAEIGTLRGGTIRSEIRKSVKRRELEKVRLWARDFRNKDGDQY
ncbi:unnamed protein product [Oikopleura dioica]|uniref:Uncharacterized protein n=1 Tax=Oikopleura dioica TaxID=34765 RepID=E4XTP3_OIKDI|nr:unnamed protein product [Oikopleura dioica]